MISTRLKELGNMITPLNRIIDVGCDHALLDIYLASKFENVVFIATDISKNAIEVAKKNVKKNNLESRIKLLVTDGLENISLFPDDYIVISGMGTNTIIKIIKSRLKEINNIVIQTNRDIDSLRKFMFDNGFKIKEEKIVFDNLYYIFIHFVKGKQVYYKEDIWLGPIIKESNNALYFKNLMKKYKKILPGIPDNDNKKIDLINRIDYLKDIIEKM